VAKKSPLPENFILLDYQTLKEYEAPQWRTANATAKVSIPTLHKTQYSQGEIAE
jgi:hypothetical protein